MILLVYATLAAYFGGAITGAIYTNDQKRRELRACYNKLEQRYRELPRYGEVIDDSSFVSVGEEKSCNGRIN